MSASGRPAGVRQSPTRERAENETRDVLGLLWRIEEHVALIDVRLRELPVLGLPTIEPDWLDQPFDQSGIQPVAPYERDPETILSGPWYDRRTRNPIAVTTAPFDGRVKPGIVHIKTIRDVLANYRSRPEAKSLGPDSRPVTRRTRGLLRRRAVENASPAHLIGKEANRIADRTAGLLQSPAEYRNDYETSDKIDRLREAISTFSPSAIAESSGLHRRTIERLRRGDSRPSAHTIRRLRQALDDLIT